MSGSSLKGALPAVSAAGRIWWVQLAVCLIIGAAVSVAAGQDASWDLRNYHLATAYSVMTGQFDRDFFPADFQSAYNPTLDFPYVYLAMGPLANYPRLLAAFMGLWFGALIFVVLRLILLLLPPLAKPERLPLILLTCVTSVTGVAAFSQVGSTSGDIPVGVIVLGGLWCVLKALGNTGAKKQAAWTNFFLGGGFLFGLAGGLKITGVVYAPALCLALLVVLSPIMWLRACAVFSVGWFAGFLPAFGWWGWMLASRFGSPTFPLFNDIFRSPWAPPVGVVDRRFFPSDAMQWLFRPFYWAFDAQHMVVVEAAIRDPRMTFAYTALAALLAGVLADRYLPSAKSKKPGLGLMPAQRMTFAFLVISYIVWLSSSSIIRYAVPIEALSIPCAVIAIYALASRFWPGISKPVTAALTGIICVLCLVGTVYIDWYRVDYGDRVFDVDMSWTPPDTLFMAVIGPVAYLSAFVPPEKHPEFIGFGYITIGGHGWPLGDYITRRIKAHRGPIEVLFTDDMRYILKDMPLTGLSSDLGPCRVIKSNIDAPLGQPVYACEARRLVPGEESESARKNVLKSIRK